MNRWLLLTSFFLVLLAPLAISWAIGHRVQHTHGDLELVIMTPHQEAIRREFAEAFDRWHRAKFGQSVNIDYRSFGTSDIVKYFSERAKSRSSDTDTFGVDLVWGGGDVFADIQMKRPGYLQPLKLDEAVMKAVYPNPRLAGLPLYDLDPKSGPCWYGATFSSFGIVYNRDVLRYLGVAEPKTWKDLADPRLAGWLAMADPTRSGSAKQVYMAIVERAMADAAEQGRSEDDGWADGMGLVRQISANARLFTDSSSVVPIMVSTGDAAAGMAIDFYGRSQADSVAAGRMNYVEPENATIINPDPIAMAKGAMHPELAKRFVEFVLSAEGQRLWNTRPGVPGGPRLTPLRRLPIDPAAYADMSTHTDPVNPFVATTSFNKSAAREKTWGIMGDLIQYSCIDLLDELRDTRAAIRKSAKRDELDASLGRFPFGQMEALRRQAMLRDPKTTVVRQLELQREWTGEFRAEYARLRERAK